MSRPIIHQAGVLDWAAAYQGEAYHALLCDPPYHLTSGNPSFDFATLPGARGHYTNPNGRGHQSKGFMGKTWDGGDLAFRAETWRAFWPLLHPGAFCMAFAGSRGWHRMAVAIEDAGYIIHPTMFLWGYGSGFPKATRIDTQIDAAAGVAQRVIGPMPRFSSTKPKIAMNDGWQAAPNITAPATDLARAWAGHRYGLQAIKPAVEPIIVFQKPYAGRPVDSITATGAGALNIEAGRIAGSKPAMYAIDSENRNHPILHTRSASGTGEYTSEGRWPANLLLSHLPACAPPDPCAVGCAVAALGAQSGENPTGGPGITKYNTNSPVYSGPASSRDRETIGYADTGTAARFFFQADYAAERLEAADPVIYRAKSSTAEREAGLSGRQTARWTDGRLQEDKDFPSLRGATERANTHATVKPIALARHLAALLLPPAMYAPRRLLVPFAGVASECIGAMQAGWEHIDGIELEADHVEIARARIAYWAERGVQLQLSLFDEVA